MTRFETIFLFFSATKEDLPPVSSAGTEVPHGQVWVLTIFSPGSLEHPPPLLKRFWSYGGWGRWEGGGLELQKSLQGVYCQPSKSLKFNRQRSKKVIFTSNCKKCRLILTVKKFQLKVLQISQFQLIFTDFTLLKNLQTGKTISRHYKTWLRILPLSKNISKFYNQEARKTSETQHLILIYAELNI